MQFVDRAPLKLVGWVQYLVRSCRIFEKRNLRPVQPRTQR